jgi:hypothetical protein
VCTYSCGAKARPLWAGARAPLLAGTDWHNPNDDSLAFPIAENDDSLATDNALTTYSMATDNYGMPKKFRKDIVIAAYSLRLKTSAHFALRRVKQY